MYLEYYDACICCVNISGMAVPRNDASDNQPNVMETEPLSAGEYNCNEQPFETNEKINK